MLTDLLKTVYVTSAEEEFALDDKAQSDSRIALLTGVHRREVKHRRERADSPVRAATALGARLIADWNALPEFVDEEGRPRPLNRSSRPAGPSIRDLVMTAGQDIRPQAILDEWLRLGVVEIGDDGRIHLRHTAFVPEHGFEEKLEFFVRILSAHIAAGTHNLSGEQPPMLDQVVYYGGLSPESAERLRTRARELAFEALTAWNREARLAQDADRGREDAHRRLHFGAYVQEDEHADDADD